MKTACGCLILLFLGCASALADGQSTHGLAKAPRKIKHLLETGQSVVPVADQELRKHLGKRFPKLKITDRSGHNVDLRKTFPGPLALFFAIGPCPVTIKWAGQFATKGWDVPGQTLVVLATDLKSPEMLLAIDSSPRTYHCGFPLPSYLVYAWFYPVMFYVDDHGIFIGFHIPGCDPVFVEGASAADLRWLYDPQDVPK